MLIRNRINAKARLGGEQMVNINKLKGKVRERQMTMLTLATETGISKDTLYRRMAEGETFTVGEVDKISHVLNLSKEEINAIFFSQSVA